MFGEDRAGGDSRTPRAGPPLAREHAPLPDLSAGVSSGVTRRSVKLPSPRNSQERLRLRFYLALVVLDFGSISVAFLAANYLRFGDLLAASPRPVVDERLSAIASS